MIRAVLFDLDGTLVDHLGAQAVALEAGLARLGLAGTDPSGDRLRLWRTLEREHMDAFLGGAYSFQEQRRRRLAAFLPAIGGDALDDGGDAAWWNAYSGDYERAWTVYADVLPCLDALAGRPEPPRLGILTNGDGRQQRAKVARVGFAPEFDGVFVSAEIGAAKPDPRAFQLACAGLGVAPAETLFVGDIPSLDALPAIEAGLVGVWLDRLDLADRPACPRITSLAEIPALAGVGVRW